MSQTPPPPPPPDDASTDQVILKNQSESPKPDQIVVIRYTNWKGETADRRVIPHGIHFGSNEWHPEPQWLMTAFDADKGTLRTFALAGFIRPPGEIKKSEEKHSCSPSQIHGIGYWGPAVATCSEDDDGFFRVGNDEYDNIVTFCPFCGLKGRDPNEYKET